MRFNDESKNKLEKELQEKIEKINEEIENAPISFEELEKKRTNSKKLKRELKDKKRTLYLDLFATDILMTSRCIYQYDKRAKDFQKYIKSAQLPSVDEPSFDVYKNTKIFIESDISSRLIFDLIKMLRSDLPNQPLFS